MRYASLALCWLSRFDWTSSNGMTEMSLAVWWSVRKCSDKFYILPKIHKQENPRGLIVFSNGHPTERLSEFVDYQNGSTLWPHTRDLHYWTTSSFKTFLQIHGTAIGTKMAPYANLCSSRFETNALTHASHKPNIWWLYIDDILLISTHSVR